MTPTEQQLPHIVYKLNLKAKLPRITLQSVANPDPEVRLSRKVQNAASQCSARTLLQDLTLTAVTCTVAGPSTVSKRNHQENKKTVTSVCDSTLTQPLPTP